MFHRLLWCLPVLLALTAPARAAAEPDCRYDGTLDDNLVLEMVVRCPDSVTQGRFFEPSARPYLSLTDPQGQPIPAGRDVALRPAGDGQTGLTYRLDLLAYAKAEDSSDTARAVGHSVLATGSAWLMQPRGARSLAVSIHIATAGGDGFATALAEEGGRHVLLAGAIWAMGYSAFGTLDQYAVTVPGRSGAASRIDVAVLDGALALPRPQLVAWVQESAAAVGAFYQGFPPDHMLLAIAPRAGRSGVGFGRTMGAGGVSVAIAVGERSTLEGLRNDWVLVHELVHAGQPYIFADWLMEGSAVYFEPIIRARAGLRSVPSVWLEWVQNMPRGLPAMTQTGLEDGDHAATYWGGALFWFLVDLDLREHSQGRIGAEDCVRALSREIGDSSARTRFDPVPPLCDRATGSSAFSRLVAAHATHGSPVDLNAIWRDLGVVPDGDAGIRVDDAAPLAWLRRAILAPPEPDAPAAGQ